MTTCSFCRGSSGQNAADIFAYCASCIRRGDEAVLDSLQRVHEKVRRQSSLPSRVPRTEHAPACRVCSRGCRPATGEKGYCGLRENREGRLIHLAGTPSRGVLQYYFDPLPTNCVADWVCPARGRDDDGKKNLAVFYGSCVLNCLFCQNWQYRALTRALAPQVSSEQLAAQVGQQTACICFFGGDPATQAPHALSTARKALAKNPSLKICWETSGFFSEAFFSRVMEVSSSSGGTVKFDIKAFNKQLYRALTGADNTPLLANFARCADYSRREGKTLAVASTLLVPGYISPGEVYDIASFIARHDPETPYSLLGFYPHFQMKDLPLTSRKDAEACYRAAREAGLSRVRLGNEHLLK